VASVPRIVGSLANSATGRPETKICGNDCEPAFIREIRGTTSGTIVYESPTYFDNTMRLFGKKKRLTDYASCAG
jgi:hypothetical protein